MSHHPVAEYLNELHTISGVSVPETSGYPALSKLLNAVGDSLKPKITAVINPSNSGAGIPDGGLFSAKELKKYEGDAPPLLKLKPERGVIEVKPLDKDLSAFESSAQVRNYLEHYSQILLTNYRSFSLWSWQGGKAVAGERYTVAASESEFWEKVHTLRSTPKHPEHERLWQFLRRALLSTARITTPQDLAAFLASYAREARARVEIAPLGTLDPIKKALSEALGVRFEGSRGTHFFQSTLIQTLFYGIFSAWVLWHESHSKPGERFQWRLAEQHLGLPILRSLFTQLTDSRRVRALHIEEVLEWTEECLARVDRASFFARYDMGEAVQYFYEPFLAEFDPELRKDFGVWYTPPEIVRYMVSRVDKALRENFAIPDGLADPRVIVLDPCCGTGAYLVETLRLIHSRLVDGYGESQAALKIREVAKKRLYGFELLPAPYVVSHLQIDLLLTRWGAVLDHDNDERAGIFLTNALTGWVPVRHPKDQLLLPEFAEERDAAAQVKQKAEILVILGNPPYDGYAGLAIEEERALTDAYRTTKEAPVPEGQGLNDLYIRFFRMAERRIAEGVPQSDSAAPGPPRNDAKGIVCYISNYSWLDGLSHPGMRERFMEVFDAISIDCLNGDKNKTGKRTPDKKPDPSVFSTEHNREGIGIGTAIAMLERRPKKMGDAPAFDEKHYSPRAQVRFRHWWGKEKRAELVASLENPREWQELKPTLQLGVPFVQLNVSAAYETWPTITELFPVVFPGVKTSRDLALTDISEDRLRAKMSRYFDAKLDERTLRKELPDLFESTQRFDAKAVRTELLIGGFSGGQILRFSYRPFDARWVYWHPKTKLLDERRAELVDLVRPGNLFFASRQKAERANEGSPFGVTPHLGDHHMTRPGCSFFPLFIYNSGNKAASAHQDLFSIHAPEREVNLSALARQHLATCGIKIGPDDESATLLWFHALAIGHAPLYLEENAGGLRQGWPRIPLPKDASTLRAGAALGRQIAALLEPETPVAGVTDLKIRPDLKGLGELTTLTNSGDKKHTAPDLKIDARWGYAGQGGVIMPGPGKVTPGTRGQGFVDIHLNPTTRWKDVPEAVWNYSLGGYQVLKKWLSYRENALINRPLTGDEAQSFTHHVRRISAILALHKELDRHYQASM